MTFSIRTQMIVDWVFQTGCFAPGSTRNDWGTLRPCLLPPMAVKSKPPALRVVVDSKAIFIKKRVANFVAHVVYTSKPLVD
jgi:hypothetical protein